MTDGHCFHKDKKTSGAIEIHPQEIYFKNDSFNCSLPLVGLTIERGGAGKRLLYFKHSSRPDDIIFTSDSSILKSPYLAQHPEVLKNKKQKAKSMILMSSICGLLFSLLVGACILFYLNTDNIIRYSAQQVPPEIEISIGDKLIDMMLEDKKKITDQALLNDLNQLTYRLTKTMDQSSYPFQFYIVKDSSINAYALPGGHVVIHSQLILDAQSPEELLGVLAHEISHVTQRHHLRGLIKNAGIIIAAQFILGDFQSIGAIISQGGAELLTLQGSRNLELEADAKAWEYLLEANINPSGFLDFFKLLEEETPSEIIPFQDMLSTHPATEERIHIIKNKIKDLKERTFPKIKFDYKSFKEEVQNKL